MSAIADAYVAACLAELDALKPGNVHRYAEGHRMTVADFERSAEVSAPAVARAGARIGARVYEAIVATRAAVGQNTNLGIVLLCAPLAAAAERPGDLRANLANVLAELDMEDARATFAAIAAANPGGLGSADEHDVRAPPAVTLREAMAAAVTRDRVARQYAFDFEDVFDVGVPACQAGGAQAAYLLFLSTFPDSHIARKFSAETAEQVRQEAVARRAAGHAALLAWDAELKARGINPGTSADLTVASLFAAALRDE